MSMMYHESRGKDEDQHHQLGTLPRLITSSPSSPSHEFSFTISLNPNSTYYTKEISQPNITKSLNSSSFLDLSPADDIFSHGQLLPLHHLPLSIPPRSSTTSIENLTFPTHDVFSSNENQTKQNSFEHHRCPTLAEQGDELIRSSATQYQETRLKANTMQKSSSPFLGIQKWRKGCEEMKAKETQDERKHETTSRKLKFDNVSHALKKCIRVVRPFLSFRIRSGAEGKHNKFQTQTYSFSEIQKEDRLRRDVGYSLAPASIWTSPTNSGHLVASTETLRSTTSSTTSDSTMEELQAAIQAAIAHCKKSFAIEDHNKNIKTAK